MKSVPWNLLLQLINSLEMWKPFVLRRTTGVVASGMIETVGRRWPARNTMVMEEYSMQSDQVHSSDVSNVACLVIKLMNVISGIIRVPHGLYADPINTCVLLALDTDWHNMPRRLMHTVGEAIMCWLVGNLCASTYASPDWLVYQKWNKLSNGCWHFIVAMDEFCQGINWSSCHIQIIAIDYDGVSSAEKRDFALWI